MCRWRWTTANVRMVGGMPGPGSTRVALLQSAAWFLCRAPRAAPVRNGLTLGWGVQPRCGWRTANTAATLRRLECRRSICDNPTERRGSPSRSRRPAPAGWNTETRTNGCTPGGLARLPVDNQASRPRDRCRSADAGRERVSGRPADPRRPQEGRSGADCAICWDGTAR